MVERILELLKLTGMNPSRFADEIGVQRSAMSHLVSGRNNPSLEFVLKVIKRFPEVNTDWLITGSGPMVRNGMDAPPAFQDTNLSAEPELFSEQPIEVPAKEEPDAIYEKPTRPQPVKAKRTAGKGKEAEKVIIVYNDNTFRELLPEQD